MSGLSVLVVDDHPAVVDALRLLFEVHDLRCRTAGSPDEAAAALRDGSVGVVVQDMNFSRNSTAGSEGIELFRAIRRIDPEMPVLLITAFASLESAVQLTKEGAADYLAKPWDDEKLVVTVRNLLALRELQLENRRLQSERRAAREELARQGDLAGLVYESEAMRRVVALALSVAASDAPVLISGPSGCGKEKVAEIIVANSRRVAGPFVRVNVGAIPEELLESELFGAEPGAYTGARALRIGRFEAAAGGTLFLDEVDALSLAGQVKLLRVLSSGEFQRLGSSRTRRADVRLISATNADLEGAVGTGGFRQDLYYRINVVSIRVPPLAARPEDVLPLARHFLAARAVEAGREAQEISSGAAAALLAHAWPGNVRELANRVHRASLVSGQRLEAADLGLGEDAGSEPAALGVGELEERVRLDRVLREEAGSVTRAAQALGVSRQALYRKMARLGIGVERRVK